MKYAILILVFLAGSKIIAQKPLNSKHMLRGYFYAVTSIKDEKAIGGFAEFGKKAEPVQNTGLSSSVFLKIDTSKTVTIKGITGYPVYLINMTDSILRLRASDSRLSIIAEAYINRKWQSIEYLPDSWCGNSYHSVLLKPKEQFVFEAPRYTGNSPCKLRYKLLMADGSVLYSNEIASRINKTQLSLKEGHTPSGVMDPYND